MTQPADDRSTAAACLVREFSVDVEDRRVPAIFWAPAGAGSGAGIGRPCPLVLVGHGGTGHKTSQLVLDAMQALVPAHGIAVAAIDGPVHGARRKVFSEGPAVREEFRALWATGKSVDPMIADWKAVIDRLCTFPEVNPEAIGWYGVSMGYRWK